MKTSSLCGAMIVLICELFSVIALGQSPDETPAPKQPLLSRVPDGSWTVTYKYKTARPSPPPANAGDTPTKPPDLITTVRVEKKGIEYHVITTKTSGARSEGWYANGIEIYKPERSDSYVRLASDNPLFVNFAKTDFDELSWIGLDNYKGVRDTSNRSKQFIFEVKNVDRRQTGQESLLTGDLGTAVEKAGLTGPKDDKKQAVSKLLQAQFGDSVSHALIDVDTQLPIEYNDGLIERTYSYSSEPPFVPNEILQVFKRMNEQARKSTVSAPRP